LNSGLRQSIFGTDSDQHEDAAKASNDEVVAVKAAEVLTEQEIADSIEASKQMIANGELQSALTTLLRLAEADETGSSLAVNSLLGVTLVAANQLRDAEDFLYVAVKLSNWTDAVAVANLAECLRLQGGENNLALAEQVATQGLAQLLKSSSSPPSSLTPAAAAESTSLLRTTLGSIHYTRGNYSAAGDWFLSAAAVSPTSVPAWLRASTLAFPAEHRDLTFAQNVLLRALESNRGDARLLFHLGLALNYQGKLHEAIELYLAALQAEPGNATSSA